MPADFREQLTEFVRIKTETGLLQLDEISLDQWYQERKLETIDRTIDLAKLRSSTGQLEEQLASVVKESTELGG